MSNIPYSTSHHSEQKKLDFLTPEMEEDIKKLEQEEKQMATLKDEAQAYEPKRRKNVADLEKIPVNLELKEGTSTNMKGEEYTYKYLVIEGEEYRVPSTVLGGIKGILEKMPNTEFVSVLRTGTTKDDTKYQVIPFVDK